MGYGPGTGALGPAIVVPQGRRGASRGARRLGRLSEGEVLVRYRTFTPEELAEIVDSGTVLPAGITRFRIKERVLGVRYPLDRMMEGDPGARNAELKEFVEEHWEENRIRYYGEPVVLFE